MGGRLLRALEERGRSVRCLARQPFDPTGLAGLLYWYGIHPLHALVFRAMLAGIARAALCERADPPPPEV